MSEIIFIGTPLLGKLSAMKILHSTFKGFPAEEPLSLIHGVRVLEVH